MEREREYSNVTRTIGDSIHTIHTIHMAFVGIKNLDLYRVEETHTRTATPSPFMPAYTLQVSQGKLICGRVMTMN